MHKKKHKEGGWVGLGRSNHTAHVHSCYLLVSQCSWINEAYTSNTRVIRKTHPLWPRAYIFVKAKRKPDPSAQHSTANNKKSRFTSRVHCRMSMSTYATQEKDSKLVASQTHVCLYVLTLHVRSKALQQFSFLVCQARLG